MEIKETLSREITVSAVSSEDAIRQIRRLYNAEKLILDSSHFTDVQFYVHHDPLSSYHSTNLDFTLIEGDCTE